MTTGGAEIGLRCIVRSAVWTGVLAHLSALLDNADWLQYNSGILNHVLVHPLTRQWYLDCLYNNNTDIVLATILVRGVDQPLAGFYRVICGFYHLHDICIVGHHLP